MTNTTLCSQVLAIQRLHREVRSVIAFPCSVAFSLAHQRTGVSLTGSNSGVDVCDPNVGGGDGWTGTAEARFPRNSRRDVGWQQRWGNGSGNMAVLYVEVRVPSGNLPLNEERAHLRYARSMAVVTFVFDSIRQNHMYLA